MSKVIHKINNLLASSSLAAELLLKEIPGKLNTEQKKYLEDILSDGKEIQKLLNKIPEQ